MFTSFSINFTFSVCFVIPDLIKFVKVWILGKTFFILWCTHCLSLEGSVQLFVYKIGCVCLSNTVLSSVFAVNGSTETWLTRATELTHSLLNVSNTVYSHYKTTWTTISRLLSQLFCRYSINSFSFLCILKKKILVCFLTWNEQNLTWMLLKRTADNY